MRQYEPRKPVGLETVCRAVDEICADADMFRHTGFVPDPLLIQLDAKEGRTAVVQYMADMFRLYGVLGFASGRDAFLELFPDGTLDQLRTEVFDTIRDAAEYDNYYREVIAVSVTPLADHLNERQPADFIDYMAEVCSHAFVIFYVSHTPTAREERLISRLTERIPKIRRLAADTYTAGELARISERMIADRGIRIEDAQAFRTAAAESLQEACSVRDARALAERLMRRADYTGFTPVLTRAAWTEENAAYERSMTYGQK